METYDVVIIGAGLAGLQCGKLLARQGAKNLLVDRKIDLKKGIHTTGIFVRKTFKDFDHCNRSKPIAKACKNRAGNLIT
jgi:flavin-dependent dehydrogenase